MKRTKFQDRIEKYLIKFKEDFQFLPSRDPNRKWQYFDVSDNLFPPIKHSFLQFAYDNAVPLHDYVNHVRSSQIFAINLLYPVLSDIKERNGLLKLFNIREKYEIIYFTFEYSPEKNLLGEWSGNIRPSQYITSSDVYIECKDKKSNDKIAVLIEVKFTELEFSPCNGYTSKGNKEKYCDDFKKLKENKSRCYLQQKYKSRSARNYLNTFDLNKINYEGEKCPFISNHQCLRNHALANELKKEHKFKETYFGLIYYDENEEIKNEWENYTKMFKNNDNNRLFSLKASEIVKFYSTKNETYKKYFEKRYRI